MVKILFYILSVKEGTVDWAFRIGHAKKFVLTAN